MSHTPGPWIFDGGIIQANCFSVAGDPNGPTDGGWVAPVAFCAPLSFRDDDLEEWAAPGSIHANARLIAAAPDLLEALALLLASVSDHAETGEVHPAYTVDTERARAAIAKARGAS